MANQPAHEWNASVFHEVEKAARDNITLARRVLKNTRSANPQVLSFEDPEAAVAELSTLTCTLLDVLEDQGVTHDMVARLMGKMAGGRDHAIHRLLPQVKKEIKLEMKDCKSLTIPHLNQKKAEIAAGRRRPKAKGKGKGPKSSRGPAAHVDCVEDDVQEHVEGGKRAERVLDAAESKERRTLEHMDILCIEHENKENEGLIESELYDRGHPEGRDEASMSAQGGVTDVDSEEIAVCENFAERKCTEQVSDTSERKKRKRTKSTNVVLKADHENKEKEGMATREASDEHAVL